MSELTAQLKYFKTTQEKRLKALHAEINETASCLQTIEDLIEMVEGKALVDIEAIEIMEE